MFYLEHKFWLNTVYYVAAEILTYQMYQLFSPYISWNEYHHTPILFMIDSLHSLNSLCKLNNNFHFQMEAPLMLM